MDKLRLYGLFAFYLGATLLHAADLGAGETWASASGAVAVRPQLSHPSHAVQGHAQSVHQDAASLLNPHPDTVATIQQKGDFNQADIRQNGVGQSASLTQIGNRNTASITQNADNQKIVVTQTGNGGQFRIVR
ncbi:hypothetical protein KSF73_10675 [Burkholderiaceae bacterium DAT-1]|nr:hypothetical protein [Burkholderiaceae bacterium DAT-1]